MRVPALRLENTSKRFGRKIILDRIDLDIYSGEIFGLMGPSGVGKTTFLQTLVGHYTPNEGDILYTEHDPVQKKYVFKSIFKNSDVTKRMFGYAAQNPSFYMQLTVQENLDYFGSLFDIPRDVRKNNIHELLRFTGLDASRAYLAKNLSGGMKRRLDIACALVHNPQILVLDEPTSDLDPVLSGHIWKLLKKINKKGTTIVVASHNLSDLETLCTRVGILTNGKLSPVGTIPELFKKIKKCQEIHVETYPGHYDKVLKDFKHPSLIKKENRGYAMVFFASKPEEVIHKLIHHLEEKGEHMTDMRLKKLQLDDVYHEVVRKK